MDVVQHMKNERKSMEHKGKRQLSIFRKNVFIKKYNLIVCNKKEILEIEELLKSIQELEDKISE